MAGRNLELQESELSSLDSKRGEFFFYTDLIAFLENFLGLLRSLTLVSYLVIVPYRNS